METIIKGFFLKEYISKTNENDSTIFIFGIDGIIYKLYSKGINKPNSKNRNNLIDYSFVEVEFFKYRNKRDGLLKKVKLIPVKFYSKIETFFNILRRSYRRFAGKK